MSKARRAKKPDGLGASFDNHPIPPELAAERERFRRDVPYQEGA